MADVTPLSPEDRTAWEALVPRYRQLMYAVALRFRLTDAELDDAYQTCWAVAFSKGGPPPPDGRVRFLVSIASWVSRDVIRRRGRNARIPDELRSIEVCGDPPAPEVVAAMEQRQVLFEALDSLRKRDRELLEEIFLSSAPRSYQEIAKKFGVSIGSVGPLRARALDRLRDALARRGIDRL